MLTNCYICGKQFELDIDEFLENRDPLDENNEDVCEDCAAQAIDFWRNLKLN